MEKSDSLVDFMSAFRLGQAPISPLKLKSSLYLSISSVLLFLLKSGGNGTDLFANKEFVDLSEISVDYLVPTKNKGLFIPSLESSFFPFLGI